MQTGTLSRRGNWWYLRFYEPALIGEEVVKRQRAVKLVKVSEEFPDEASVRRARLERQILAPVNTGTASPDSTQPAAEFIEFVYMPHVQTELKPKTYSVYMYNLKLLKPHFGNLELRKVRTRDIEDILKAVRTAKPCANSTMKHLKNFLSGAFRFAVRRGFLTLNPVREAEAPKGLTSGDTYATLFPETRTMLKVLKEPARTIVLTMALTGLRMNELAGLKWTDVKENELLVARQVHRGKLIETKTEDSKAAIPLVATVREALAKHRQSTHARGEFVFSGVRDGKPVVMDNVKRRQIEPVITKKGISWHGWHSFRRGLATELKQLDVDDLMIARIMRHGGGTVTQVHYIKTVPKAAQEAMRKAEEAFLTAR